MRAIAYGCAVLLLGSFAGCSSPTDGDTGEEAAGKAGAVSAGAGSSGKSSSGGSAGSSTSGGTSSGAFGGASSGAGAGGSGGNAGASGNANGGNGAGGVGGTAGVGGTGGAPQANAGTSGLAGADSTGDGGFNGEGGDASEGGDAGQNTVGASGAPNEVSGLSWPIDCIPDQTCAGIGYPDIDDDGQAHDCGAPGYVGHEGTDIRITLEMQLAGTAVRAAADGVVLFAFDGKYDQCPNANEPDCQDPPSLEPGATTGNTVCTPEGPYCGTGQPGCSWCFAGGNVLVIRHTGVPGVFATRYDHLKKNSVLVRPGDTVTRGQKIAEAASAGSSTAPHLHFEVWGTGFYELADPWAGPCGPNTGPSLWAYDPPWSMSASR